MKIPIHPAIKPTKRKRPPHIPSEMIKTGKPNPNEIPCCSECHQPTHEFYHGDVCYTCWRGEAMTKLTPKNHKPRKRSRIRVTVEWSRDHKKRLYIVQRRKWFFFWVTTSKHVKFRDAAKWVQK